jgi:hypothetical protein
MRSTLFFVLAFLVSSGTLAQTNQAAAPESAKKKIEQAKTLLGDAKQALQDDGKYDCCIKDACDACALAHQSCNCKKDVKSDKPVCAECYAGWQSGQGRVPGIDPAHVKVSSHVHKH